MKNNPNIWTRQHTGKNQRDAKKHIVIDITRNTHAFAFEIAQSGSNLVFGLIYTGEGHNLTFFSLVGISIYALVGYNNTTNQPVDVSISWAGGDPANEPVVYDVYFGTSDNNLYLVYTNSNSQTYYPGPLSESVTYYWRVIARDIHGATAASPIWSFTTVSKPTPSPTPSPLPTQTNTPLPIPTSTSTPTSTPFPTTTSTPTSTQVPTATPHTPTSTHTATATTPPSLTPTATTPPSPTPTATATITPSPTITPTPTVTPSPTIPLPPAPVTLLGPTVNNGGFETGNMSLWTTQDGSVNVNGEMVHSGNYSVEGSEQGDESEGEPPVKFWQDLSLAPYQIWINAGLGIANIEGWLRNGNSESYRFKVTFYNSSGNSLDAYDTGWIHNASGDYFHYANVRSIPVGTAYVRVEGQMKRNAGSYTDVNIDDLTFIIQFNNP